MILLPFHFLRLTGLKTPYMTRVIPSNQSGIIIRNAAQPKSWTASCENKP